MGAAGEVAPSPEIAMLRFLIGILCITALGSDGAPVDDVVPETRFLSGCKYPHPYSMEGCKYPSSCKTSFIHEGGPICSGDCSKIAKACCLTAKQSEANKQYLEAHCKLPASAPQGKTAAEGRRITSKGNSTSDKSGAGRMAPVSWLLAMSVVAHWAL